MANEAIDRAAISGLGAKAAAFPPSISFMAREPAPKSAHAAVARNIAMSILNGDYPEGSQLPREAELISRFAVSRTVLREALKTLAAKGLLVAKTKVGTRILEGSNWNMIDSNILKWRIELGIDASFLRALFELRQALEPTACALAAVRRTDANLDEMRQALAGMSASGEAPETFAARDVAFHRAILMASANPYLQSLGSVIEAAIYSSFDVSTPTDSPERFALSIGRHTAVFDAIEAQDSQAASAAMSKVIAEGVQNAHGELAEEPLVVALPVRITP